MFETVKGVQKQLHSGAHKVSWLYFMNRNRLGHRMPSGCISWYSAVAILHSKFKKNNLQDRHPIACMLGQAMGWLLWVQTLIYVISDLLQRCMQYCYNGTWLYLSLQLLPKLLGLLREPTLPQTEVGAALLEMWKCMAGYGAPESLQPAWEALLVSG